MILAMAAATWWFMWTATGGAAALTPSEWFTSRADCMEARKTLLHALVLMGSKDAMALVCEERK